ncbi:hypothetical protein DDE84_02770 [Bifidobacterium tibiigranuli]|jgi:hypothetical protein|uniref:Uncharacterized protein n=1 Tax=Bifidobacterium tibiigranuli TaxID=2172043 RepID=A0A5N6RYE7_9BIFI|nr:hypothetical protein DDF78_08990 [Bifidobacterium tibiigranuli]KAE8129736.1 hypothetical protein DDE84_02770 [Bifidobacterium tibiigranuli]
MIFHDSISLLKPAPHRLVATKYVANKRKLHAHAEMPLYIILVRITLPCPRKTVHLTLFNHQSTTHKYEYLVFGFNDSIRAFCR